MYQVKDNHSLILESKTMKGVGNFVKRFKGTFNLTKVRYPRYFHRLITMILAIFIAFSLSLFSPTVQANNIESGFDKPLWRTSPQQNHVLLGIYTSASLQVSAPEIGRVNAWLKHNGLKEKVAIAGTFMDIEFPNPEWNIPHDLDAAWDQGAVPFVNLAVGTAGFGPRSANDVANGSMDGVLRQWASIFAQWTQGGRKRAYIAPLQEMNANWVSYGLDPENYKLAFTRIQRIFIEEGVPEGSVLWVFAPNGWSEPGQEFEKYYPGDDVVDVVGFSAFNFGACVASGEGWDSYEEAIKPYVVRMEAMAPEKPIFLAQTGTVEQGGDKGNWLVDTFKELSQVQNFRGLIYFNVSKEEAGAPSCNPVDWRVYDPEMGEGEEGFVEALQILSGGAATPANFVFIPMISQ
jgi:hypothetical protein